MGGWGGAAKGIGKGGAQWSRAGGGGSRFFLCQGSTGAGNEVLMLLMGRDKQSDQSMSTIAGQQRVWETAARWSWRSRRALEPGRPSGIWVSLPICPHSQALGLF